MEQAIDWFFRVAVLGIVVFVAKGYLDVRTSRQKAADQVLSVGEHNDICERIQKSLKEDLEKDMSHIHELIKKDLERGQLEFVAIRSQQKETGAAINRLATAVELLNQRFGQLNGTVNHACGPKTT